MPPVNATRGRTHSSVATEGRRTLPVVGDALGWRMGAGGDASWDPIACCGHSTSWSSVLTG
jgi:hypothetical protein